MSFFIRLIESTDASRCTLEGVPEMQQMLNGKMTAGQYQIFLVDLLHILSHFRPILETAASHCPDEFQDVRAHLHRSMAQEQGREAMIVNDLAIFGIDANAIRSDSPSYAAQVLVAYNYHASARAHPCNVLGMLYVLELFSSVYSGHLAAAISAGIDRPLPEGFTFLNAHAAMDLDHVARLRELFKTVGDPVMQDVIINAIRMNFYLLTQFIKSPFQRTSGD